MSPHAIVLYQPSASTPILHGFDHKASLKESIGLMSEWTFLPIVYEEGSTTAQDNPAEAALEEKDAERSDTLGSCDCR